jgi:hypothetical protein
MIKYKSVLVTMQKNPGAKLTEALIGTITYRTT